jgi:hypothetical protein
MRIEADDEVYRVNAVWLGPEHFQFPWRATYRAYGIGILLFVVLLAVARQLYGVTFWTLVFTLVVAIKLTQIVNRRMGYERPFSAVLAMALHEMSAPREVSKSRGYIAAAKTITRASDEPTPPHSQQHVGTITRRRSVFDPQTRKRSQ